MKNSFGQSVTVTLFGESHGPEIGAVLDGIAPGIPVDEAYIASRLDLRRPTDDLSTSRREPDPFRIVSGVYCGKTTGTPLCILIPNRDTDRNNYDTICQTPRPGHADYTGYIKYSGYSDPAGGGHFSGRLTAPLTAVGAIVLNALKHKNIRIGTHIRRCAHIEDRPFSLLPEAEIDRLEYAPFAVLNSESGSRMKAEIHRAAANGDSLGGILETAVTGLPVGLGEPWFGGVENALASALFGIPAVKGVSFGDGFDLAGLPGSVANDPFVMQNGHVMTETNHNGGVNGGITNGMPLLFQCAVKPTPSIAQSQKTVDLRTKENTTLRIEGRHDPAIVHRARVVVDAITALVLCDLLALRYGTDWLREDIHGND